MKNPPKLSFAVHTPRLLNEVLVNPGTEMLTIPLQVFGRLLFDVGIVASRINDPVLNALMCKLTIYSIADPDSKDYDAKKLKKIMEALD